jgi:hypothetical protein
VGRNQAHELIPRGPGGPLRRPSQLGLAARRRTAARGGGLVGTAFLLTTADAVPLRGMRERRQAQKWRPRAPSLTRGGRRRVVADERLRRRGAGLFRWSGAPRSAKKWTNGSPTAMNRRRLHYSPLVGKSRNAARPVSYSRGVQKWWCCASFTQAAMVVG